jgi:hypothetical protein
VRALYDAAVLRIFGAAADARARGCRGSWPKIVSFFLLCLELGRLAAEPTPTCAVAPSVSSEATTSCPRRPGP